MKTVAIVQARMGSSRLPGKVLLPLAGMCSLDWCIARVLQADCVDEVCVATTTNPTDRAIDYHMEKWKGNPKVCVFTGSENNVFLRTLMAARKRKAHIIVDVTSDCPMVDPRHIDLMWPKVGKDCVDYCSNVMRREFPDGLDIQIYTKKALEMLWHYNYSSKKFMLKTEHSGINFVIHKNLFEVHHQKAPIVLYYPKWRWTLDTPEDWKRLEWLISEMVQRFGNFYPVDKIPEMLGLNDLAPSSRFQNTLKEMMEC